MSGSSYDDNCPRCGGTMSCYEDRKPHDYVSGFCLDCGYEYHTVDGQMSLEGVNEVRADGELQPLTEFRNPLKEWLESPYGRG